MKWAYLLYISFLLQTRSLCSILHGGTLTCHDLFSLVPPIQRTPSMSCQIRHPGVSDIMHRDFVLMQRAARFCSLLPGLSELRLDESIRQFGGPLKEQVWGAFRKSLTVYCC